MYDIVIIGAGPVGLCFARSLAATGSSVAIIEQQGRETLADPPNDGREIALTHKSRDILVRLGIWDKIPSKRIAAIRNAKVLNGRSAYNLHFAADASDKDQLGFMISNHEIRRAAYATVSESGHIELFTDATVINCGIDNNQARVICKDGLEIEAQLLVAADSRFSAVRSQLGISASMLDFGRTCIVCQIEHEAPQLETAYECFHYDRTLAILPMPGQKCSAVITVDNAGAADIETMPADALARDIEARIGGILGQMRVTGARHSYPLVGVYARRFYGRNCALIGDAAVGMHPVTAHGFNLGLYGQEALAAEIDNGMKQGLRCCDSKILRAYHRRHTRIAYPLYTGTNALVQLYTDKRAMAKVMRHTLLRLGNRVSPARRAITGLLT